MENPFIVLYYPMLAMFLWTFLVMLRNVHVRVRAVLRGELDNEYFELFEGASPPEVVTKTGNHLRNLFEFPVLFYAAVLVAGTLERTATLLVVLAWAYVALRVGRSLVHLSFNKIPARFACFMLSNVVLAALWVSVGLIG